MKLMHFILKPSILSAVGKKRVKLLGLTMKLKPNMLLSYLDVSSFFSFIENRSFYVFLI